MSKLLTENNAKATFFVSAFSDLDDSRKNKLVKLSQTGFEIGVHTLHHIEVCEFIKNHSIQQYYSQEILPEVKIMKDFGIYPTSFAYPFGKNCSLSDTFLLNKFNKLRVVTDFQRHSYNSIIQDVCAMEDFFFKYKSNKIISSLGIDENFNISIKKIEECFQKAKRNKSIIVLYAHKPVKNVEYDYEISYAYLEEIIVLAKQIGLKSYKFSDL